ncbi:MAG: PIG-L deacetylase family protein [Bacillota bacterium]|nr:PIG-L deacetylase family protein [Bacillota bacterium]
MATEAEVLVIMPHPDDAEFGAAGTVARWTREGKDVVLAVCTNGDKGTRDRDMLPETLARIREDEQLASADVLGVKEVVFLGHPDQGLEETPEFRKEIVRLIRTYRPETVVTVDPYRRYVHHRDHRICGQVVLDAVFPYARDHLAYPDLLAQGFEPHKVRQVLLWGAEEPNHRSDITQTFALKVAALRCHESQVGDRFPELEERLRKRATALAEGESFELAEAFYRVELT